jgi:hypothetical protein
MAYTPYYPGGWQSGEEGGTPITPAALNNIENGIGGAVAKSGDTMTGSLSMTNGSVLRFKPASGRENRVGYIYSTVVSATDKSRIGVAVYATDNTTYPDYFAFPDPTERTTDGNNSFMLLSTKNPVTIPQGGTNATTAKGARSNLSAATDVYFSSSDNTWAKVFALLDTIPTLSSAAFFADASVATILTNAKVTGTTFKGTIHRASTDMFDFIASTGLGNYLYCWRISNATSSSGTVGTVYRYTGTAI